MEVVKQNCNYTITDTFENGQKLAGNASKDVYGYISINYSVTNELGEEIGNCNYSKQPNSDRVNLGYYVVEANKAEFITQSDTVITDVLNRINTAE